MINSDCGASERRRGDARATRESIRTSQSRIRSLRRETLESNANKIGIESASPLHAAVKRKEEILFIFAAAVWVSLFLISLRLKSRHQFHCLPKCCRVFTPLEIEFADGGQWPLESECASRSGSAESKANFLSKSGRRPRRDEIAWRH